MIFHRLTLQDFGLFRGSHTFSLTPRIKYNKPRPIILIGGKNGAGKTTILEAVRLCLYGARSLGNRVSRNVYQEYLASMIHHSPLTLLQPDKSSVAIEFEHVLDGKRDHYRVERQWGSRQSTKEPIAESLTIHKNSEPLSDFEAEQWQDFLNELVPIGLSQLFFFDGEKIQGLAEDTSSPEFLADSIKSLLGLDLVERLQSDLKVYLYRSKKDTDTNQISCDINSAEEELRDLEAQLGCTEEKKANLEARIDEIEIQISLQEEQITREGGNYARRREHLKIRQAALSEKIEALRNQVKEACSGLLPFAFAPSLCERLRERLIKEETLEAWRTAQSAVKDSNRNLLDLLATDDFWNSVSESQLSSGIRDSITKRIANLLSGQIQPTDSLEETHQLHHLSNVESQQLLNWIDQSLHRVPQRFHELNHELNRSHSELQEVDRDLARIPADEVLQPLMIELNRLHQQFGALRKQEHDEIANIQSLMYRQEKAQRHLDQLRESQQNAHDDMRRSQLVSDVQSVLHTYSDELTHAKIDALSKEFVNCFNQLCRKRGMVKRIQIAPDSFAAVLYDQEDRSIAKEELSAGEKQIYAISVLWALARTSGRPLPMIIDTPLGRLDSEHRDRMIEHYFPNASHQVVVLSTDTELDKRNFEILSPHISHAYHLEYNQIGGHTNSEERYFWKTIDSAER